MSTIIESFAVQLGAIGVLVCVLLYLLYRFEKKSRESSDRQANEREIWRKQLSDFQMEYGKIIEKMHNDHLEISKETNQAIRHNSILISELVVLFKSKLGRSLTDDALH